MRHYLTTLMNLCYQKEDLRYTDLDIFLFYGTFIAFLVVLVFILISP